MAKRKLTTIFCADAVHYGALMASDEDATLARLEEYREVMNDQFARFHGREINTWGDAIIAEFESVVEAVRCAVEIQLALNSRNDILPEKSRLQFRIGINLGDVIHQGDNIYGDGVNVASRLEALADPGGIMVSKSVRDFTSRQLAVAFDFSGRHEAKAGEEPIEGYRVRLGGDNAGRVPDRPEADARPDADKASPDFKNDARTLFGNLQSLPSVSWAKTWFDAQSQKVRFSALAISILFAINLLFTGIANPWFIFPSLPFLAVIFFGRTKTGE